MLRKIFCSIAVAGGVCVQSIDSYAGEYGKASIIGVSTVGSKYSFTDKPLLIESADVLKELGTHVIKIFLTPQYKTDYPINTIWKGANVKSLRALAESEPFRTILEDPWWETVVIVAMDFTANEFHSWRKGLPLKQQEHVTEEFRDLTRWLIKECKGEHGKPRTFVLQNWESDNALYDYGYNSGSSDEVSSAIKHFTEYLNARMLGIKNGRMNSDHGLIRVMGAMEVNVISTNKWKDSEKVARPKAINAIVPHTHFDLYSYSNYETIPFNYGEQWKEQLRRNLAELKKAAINRDQEYKLGEHFVFLGEYGRAEHQYGSSADDQLKIVKGETEVALQLGLPYVIYWELYCNEIIGCKQMLTPTVPSDPEHMKGTSALVLKDGKLFQSVNENGKIKTAELGAVDSSKESPLQGLVFDDKTHQLSASQCDFITKRGALTLMSQNGLKDRRPTNSEMHGFWLRRPDGTYSPVWKYFQNEFAKPLMKSIENGSVYSKTDNWTQDTGHLNRFAGQKSRWKRTKDLEESITYSQENLSQFVAHVYYYPKSAKIEHSVQFSVSDDGSEWKIISVDIDSTPTADGWMQASITPRENILSGVRYLKITLKNDAQIWSPQLGDVQFNAVREH